MEILSVSIITVLSNVVRAVLSSLIAINCVVRTTPDPLIFDSNPKFPFSASMVLKRCEIVHPNEGLTGVTIGSLRSNDKVSRHVLGFARS